MTITRVSVDSAGNQAIGSSLSPSISADGRFMAFESDASNLVPGDNNNSQDIFVRNLLTNTITR
ncbi:calcium-binding protein, partial [Microcoleus sp. herbarium12]